MIFASLLSAAALVTSACAQSFTVPGSGSPEVALRELARAFNQRVGSQRVAVPASTGTAGGVRAVENNEAPLGRIARALTPDETARGLRAHPFARDAVVFAVGAAVTVNDLTERQLADLFAGRIASWDALGGGARLVRLIAREPTETSLMAIRAALPGFRNLVIASSAKQVNRDSDALKLLESYGASIGFLTQVSLHAAESPLRTIAVGGVAPTAANLASARYPIFVTYALVSKGAPTREAGEFVDFIYSAPGRAVMDRLGMLPLPRS